MSFGVRPFAVAPFAVVVFPAAAPPVTRHNLTTLGVGGMIAPEAVLGAAAAAKAVHLVRQNPVVTRRRIITLGNGPDAKEPSDG